MCDHVTSCCLQPVRQGNILWSGLAKVASCHLMLQSSKVMSCHLALLSVTSMCIDVVRRWQTW